MILATVAGARDQAGKLDALRGGRGGDQQLGALIAAGELDAVIFFADPTVPHGGDADLQALTRLAVLHDIPIALSTAAADMVVKALIGPE